MTKTIVLLGTAATILAGCATSSKTYGPNGEVAYSIGCSGMALNWGMCMEKAGDLCGTKGYNVISATGDVGNLVVANAQARNASLVGGSVMNRSMIVSCKG